MNPARAAAESPHCPTATPWAYTQASTHTLYQQENLNGQPLKPKGRPAGGSLEASQMAFPLCRQPISSSGLHSQQEPCSPWKGKGVILKVIHGP